MKQWVRFATTIILVLLLATVIGCAVSLPTATPAPSLTPSLAATPTPSLTSSLAATPALTATRPSVGWWSNIYIGSMHSAHTFYSDGQMEYPGEFYSTFKPYWDWIATTDHDYAISSEEWRSTIENANAYNGKDFVSLIGYEWTSSAWGHLSVVFRGEPPSKTPLPASASDPAYDSPRKLYSFLSTADGLVAFAHPAHPGLYTDFNRQSDYRNDAVACLASTFGYGDRIHWNASWDYADGRRIPVPGAEDAYARGWIKWALDRGYRLGFVGELDLHEKTIDPRSYRYTGVVADSLTREGIFEALKSRHSYSVRSRSGLGKRILLRADTGNHLMGDIFANESGAIEVTLQGKTDLAQFTSINLFVDGKITQSRDVSGRDLVENFSFTLADGENYTFFEVRAISAEGQVSQAFTSPMYVTVGKMKS